VGVGSSCHATRVSGRSRTSERLDGSPSRVCPKHSGLHPSHRSNSDNPRLCPVSSTRTCTQERFPALQHFARLPTSSAARSQLSLARSQFAKLARRRNLQQNYDKATLYHSHHPPAPTSRVAKAPRRTSLPCSIERYHAATAFRPRIPPRSQAVRSRPSASHSTPVAHNRRLSAPLPSRPQPATHRPHRYPAEHVHN
jgi:hypothetical protein